MRASMLFSCAIPAATLQGLTANHYYWLNSDNTVTDGGTTATAITGLNAKACFDADRYDYIKVYLSAGAQTGSTGGTLGLIDLWPTGLSPGLGFALPSGVTTGPNQYFWTIGAASQSTACTTIVPALAQTQSSGSVNCSTLVTAGGRVSKGALNIFFSAAPSTGAVLNVAVQGFTIT